jgi:MSHA biogenesis protein MshO
VAARLRPPERAGFTLVELVVVIVLLGILGLVGANLIGNFVGGYVDASERQELAATGRLAVERATREVRRAVPNSVLCPGGCSGVGQIAFMRAATGGRYVAIGPPASRLQVKNDGDQFVSFGLTGVQQTDHLVVYPQQASTLYGSIAGADSSPRARQGAAPADLGSGSEIKHGISLQADDDFPRHSPRRRLLAVDQVTALCCDTLNNTLALGIGDMREPLGASAAHFCNDANPGVTTHRLAGDVTTCAFSYTPGTLTRTGVVRLHLGFTSPETTEQVDFLQEVQIRNVP